MDEERVEFRAGRDNYGLARWVAGLVQEREQRADGLWLKILPVCSASDEDAQWVQQKDVRSAIGSS
ncbi:hypothetical protein HCC61_26990 [Streptomyces sp. HNM0575]|uniref:hypothetical protein n=1 Tax=Streptomyces sp. HNM0575 TaxID=2716338 RepID=UPI00145DD557|nr:hypothetical protein [Streptomyces sp. HNM0575]NLU76243.1 hypothetical protein [Streptomyces sp. HNM0575]